MADNAYNVIDRANGSVRARFLTDRVIFDSQYTKEVCNMMGLRQLGCSTGTLQDFGPDFGLTYVLDGSGCDGAEMMTGVRAHAKAAVAIGAAAIFSSGCATNGLASLPLPAPGVGSGGYTLTAIFSNALNLPMNAKVKLAGADVGQVESMVARNYTAVTTLRIRDGVLLPKGSTAELRTATPLGDVFVSLRPPAEADPNTPMLRNGDTIGLESTAAAATVESVLSSAAVLVNGGAVRNFTNIINGVGKATGDKGQAFGDLIRKTNRLLGTLDSRSDQISTALTELSSLAEELDAKDRAITELVAAAGPATDALAANTTQLSDLASAGRRHRPAAGQVPDDRGDRHQRPKHDPRPEHDRRGRQRHCGEPGHQPAGFEPVDSRRWSKPPPGNAIAVRASVDKLVLGSIPDIGFPGDIGLHGPHRYNWNQLIGSLKYTLWRLQERVVGRGPNSPQVPVIPDPLVPGQIDIAPPPGPPPGPPAIGPPAMIATFANVLVRVVRAGHRRQVWLSVAGLVITLVVATAYLLIGALRVTPFASSYGSPCSYRNPVGCCPIRTSHCAACGSDGSSRADHRQGGQCRRQHHIEGEDPGDQRRARVRAVSRRRAIHQLRSRVRRGAVSAGRQHRRAGPDHRPGRPGADCSSDADGMLAQVDPRKVEMIKKELSLSKEGPAEAGRHRRRRHVPAVDARFGAAPNHQHHQDQPGRADAGDRQERRTGRRHRGTQPNPGRRGQNARRLSAFDRADTADAFGRRQPVRRQLRHHGAVAGQHGHHVTAAVSAGAGAQRAVPELPRLGAGRVGEHLSRPWRLGDGRDSIPATAATTEHRRIRLVRRLLRAVHVHLLPRRRPGVLIRGAKNAPRPGGDDTAGPPPGADLGRKPIRHRGAASRFPRHTAVPHCRSNRRTKTETSQHKEMIVVVTTEKDSTPRHEKPKTDNEDDGETEDSW